MFHHPEILRVEVEARRERLIRDVQAHPRRKAADRPQLRLHLPLLSRRPA